MNYDPGFAYRQHSVEGTSPVGLVVLLYGSIVASLLRAQEAMKQNDVEKRVRALNHALKVIGQLQATLDHQRGGHVAAQLDRFYKVMSARVMEASIKCSPEILQELVRYFTLLREAWQEVERSTANATGTPANRPDDNAAKQPATV
jgi:flagellar protein FliS